VFSPRIPLTNLWRIASIEQRLNQTSASHRTGFSHCQGWLTQSAYDILREHYVDPCVFDQSTGRGEGQRLRLSNDSCINIERHSIPRSSRNILIGLCSMGMLMPFTNTHDHFLFEDTFVFSMKSQPINGRIKLPGLLCDETKHAQRSGYYS
jgi:hypothetical protein